MLRVCTAQCRDTTTTTSSSSSGVNRLCVLACERTAHVYVFKNSMCTSYHTVPRIDQSDFTAVCTDPSSSCDGSSSGSSCGGAWLGLRNGSLYHVTADGARVLVHRFRSSVSSLHTLDGGARVLVQAMGDSLALYDRDHFATPLVVFAEHVNTHVFSAVPTVDASGRVVACRGSDGIVRVWWRATGQLLWSHRLEGAFAARIQLHGSALSPPLFLAVLYPQQADSNTVYSILGP